MFSAGSLFKRKPAPLIGLDVSASGVKLVELNQDNQGSWILERCASEPLDADWVMDGNIEKFDEVADAIKRLLKKSGTKAKHVALALPHSAVITKRIILSGSLSEQELEVQVESEASQYIPFPLDEVSLDFCVIGPNAKNLGDVDVLLAATRKEKVEERNNLAVLVGLTPVVMDVESHAARLASGRWVATQCRCAALAALTLYPSPSKNVIICNQMITFFPMTIGYASGPISFALRLIVAFLSRMQFSILAPACT